jgi:hypothetical protein
MQLYSLFRFAPLFPGGFIIPSGQGALLTMVPRVAIHREGFASFISSLDAKEMICAAIFALALSAVCFRGR